MAGKGGKRKQRSGLCKRLRRGELIKLCNGKSTIYVEPARHGDWRIQAPPEFVITAEQKK